MSNERNSNEEDIAIIINYCLYIQFGSFAEQHNLYIRPEIWQSILLYWIRTEYLEKPISGTGYLANWIYGTTFPRNFRPIPPPRCRCTHSKKKIAVKEIIIILNSWLTEGRRREGQNEILAVSFVKSVSMIWLNFFLLTNNRIKTSPIYPNNIWAFKNSNT